MGSRARAARITGSAGPGAPLRVLARIGFAASAIIHLLLGYLAIRVALHHGGRSDQSGAIAQIGKLPGGSVLLWVTVVGLFALGLWLLVQAASGIGSSSTKRWIRSLVSLAKAVAYIALGLTALSFARGSSSNSKSSTQQASSGILALPGGQLLLGVIGAAVVGIGVYMVAKGLTKKFTADIDMPDGATGRAVLALGTVGYVAKGIAVGVVGVLFVVAAVSLKPNDASGLDGALKALAALPFGSALLVGVGVGLIAFGAYTAARARFARL